ncbi:hypothetical protein Cgig2_032869 [Carnegiea gigantea]|uniref:GDT1 family protein n=1 Tax=Carnegiea gigantea TaxID=171969 RepID=A0A9Q1JMV7_9CARY|nr:hypothetical protein Cgig2_032869 [Carnegiea gigantea]
MGLRLNPKNSSIFRFIFVFLLGLVLLLAHAICAQGIGADDTKVGKTGGSIKDLGRRSKWRFAIGVLLDDKSNEAAMGRTMDKMLIMLEHLGKDAHSIHLGINLDSGLGVFDGFLASLCMILVSEIGDETFIIAALMAMRHPKSIVLSGALSALFVMTAQTMLNYEQVLSTGLGRIVPNLISRKHTNSAATVLYAFFGLRLLYIAWRSDAKASQKKEIEEVEEKLDGGQGKTSIRRFFSRFCTPIFLESFILTFLAEWGDRSQIATIAVLVILQLATHKNALGVCVGAMMGHSVCTSVAVVGGSMLASKISQRTVATVGGFLFLGFSLSSYFYPPL